MEQAAEGGSRVTFPASVQNGDVGLSDTAWWGWVDGWTW